MLLGPGMHYFDDVNNVSIDPDKIILDSQGENKVFTDTSITVNNVPTLFSFILN
jgi:hypothetical protein